MWSDRTSISTTLLPRRLSRAASKTITRRSAPAAVENKSLVSCRQEHLGGVLQVGQARGGEKMPQTLDVCRSTESIRVCLKWDQSILCSQQ